MTHLVLSTYNYQDGGLQPDGTYDFAGLVAAFTDPPVPDLIGLCEAKFWHARGRRPFHTAIKELSLALDRPFVGELFTGPLATAVIYDPAVLCLDASEEPDLEDKRNLARFSLRSSPSTEVRLFVEHWSFHDGDRRLARARLLARHGIEATPTLIVGDLNSSSSGPHLPTVFHGHIAPAVRDYRHLELPDGSWVADTRAVDRLIGAWHEPHNHVDGEAGRRDSAGFHHLAELDPHLPRPFPHTGEGRQHVDYILANNALLKIATVVPGSYRVHRPAGFPPPRYSDHLRISCTLELTRPTAGANH